MTILTDELREQIRAQLVAKPAPPEKPNVQRRSSAGLWVKPFHSTALGVQPHQIEEARDYLRQRGIYAEFDAEGRCIVTSDKQYHRIATACGIKSGRDGYRPLCDNGLPKMSGRDRHRAIEEMKKQIRKEYM